MDTNYNVTVIIIATISLHLTSVSCHSISITQIGAKRNTVWTLKILGNVIVN